MRPTRLRPTFPHNRLQLGFLSLLAATGASADRFLDRHEGEPLATLDDVRDDYNVVAAMPDVVAAQALIVDLENSGIDPQRISLLGAWPAADQPVGPHVLVRRVVNGAVGGVAAGSMLGALASSRRRGVSAAVGAASGAIAGAFVGVFLGTGTSAAWQRSLGADGKGTVAVGVHSPDPAEVAKGEQVIHRHDPLSANRFDRGAAERRAGA